MTDAQQLAADARQLLDELDRTMPNAAAASAECRPSLDIFETTDAAEVTMDVPGVPADCLRVAIRRNTVLVVGAKLPAAVPADARFHLAERAYGRFARAVRVNGVFDASRAKAVFANGLLRVVLPRIEDRRGRLHRVAVEAESA